MSDWITDLAGWEVGVNSIDTCWIGDPAVDTEKSDAERYYRTLEMDALVMLPGKTPVPFTVTMPSEAAQIAELKMLAFSSVDAVAAAVRAFSMVVRFPTLEAPETGQPLYKRVIVGGTSRIPPAFLSRLIADSNGTMMITTIGCWVIQKCVLGEDEKKASSLSSTKKTSGPGRAAESLPTDVSTSAPGEKKSTAAGSESTSMGAQTSDQGPDPNRTAV